MTNVQLSEAIILGVFMASKSTLSPIGGRSHAGTEGLKYHGKMWYNFAVPHFAVPNFAPAKSPPR